MTEDTIKLALNYFSTDYNCAQSVMKSILVSKGLDFDEIFHLSAGFGGGVGLQGHICGAVSGAVASLGVINGKKYDDPKEHKEATYKAAEKLMHLFKDRNGSIICDDLTGIAIADKAAHDKAVKDGTFRKVCPGYVKDAVRIVLELTQE
ncbi:MAG: C_GCAxxG_C_C family protein [Candidatus Thorarchaeota archaeon]|nr:C_GCAxxG_C_C family protein [Candidatus Thorarchaeota archaeon]